jgi:hypothetical protein
LGFARQGSFGFSTIPGKAAGGDPWEPLQLSHQTVPLHRPADVGGPSSRYSSDYLSSVR